MERKLLIRCVILALVAGLLVSMIFSLDGYGAQTSNKTQSCQCSCNCHNCEATR